MSKSLEIYKSGNFYHSYGDDGRIIHYLMGYKFVKEKGGCGFPLSSINKVENVLTTNKISYKIFDKNNIINESNFKNLNNYNKILKKSFEGISFEEKIAKFKERIMNMTDDELDHLMVVLENELSK